MTTIIRRRRLGMSSAKGIAEFSKTGIKWVRNDKPLPEDDLYIRWGCTSNVPAKNVLNTAAAIHEVNDKTGFRKVLNEKKLCPKTWFNAIDVPLPMPLLVLLSQRDSLDRLILIQPTLGLFGACRLGILMMERVGLG